MRQFGILLAAVGPLKVSFGCLVFATFGLLVEALMTSLSDVRRLFAGDFFRPNISSF